MRMSVHGDVTKGAKSVCIPRKVYESERGENCVLPTVAFFERGLGRTDCFHRDEGDEKDLARNPLHPLHP